MSSIESVSPNSEPSPDNFNLAEQSLFSKPDGQGSQPSPLQRRYTIDLYDVHRVPDLATARAIGEIFLKVYGAGIYPSPELTDPHRLQNEVANGKFVSIVVRDELGTPVGHAAILPVGHKVAELGRLFVDPTVRAGGLGKILVDAQLSASADMHKAGILDVVFADAVTSHTFSQRAYASRGLVPTGLFDRKYTDFFGVGYRESVLRLTRIMADEIREQRNIFLPSSFHDIANHIYSANQCKRSVLMLPDPNILSGATDLKIDAVELADFGVVSLIPGPSRPPHELLEDEKQQLQSGAAYVAFKIDCTHPDALAQINVLRADGFHFAALESYPSADYLVLQKLNNDPSKDCCPHIKDIHPKEAQDLMDLMQRMRFIQ